MPPVTEMLTLPEITREVRRRYGRVPHSRIWRAAVEGDVPAEKHGRQWYVAPEHIPQLAAALGLTPKPTDAAA
jgi:hypothetical protein